MMFAVQRLQELVVMGRKARVPVFLCFIDLQKAYDSVDRTLLWRVRARLFWSAAADDRGDPPVPRWDESLRAE